MLVDLLVHREKGSMTSIKLRLGSFETEALENLTGVNPALTRHRAGHVALRLGLRLLEQDGEALNRELRAMASERGPHTPDATSPPREAHTDDAGSRRRT